MGLTLDKHMYFSRNLSRRLTFFRKVEKEVDAEIERQKLHFRPEGLDALASQTKFTRKEIQLLYRSFKEVDAEIERQKLHFRPEGLDALASQTKFTRKEIQLLYRSFKENCPNGIVTLEQFKSIFSQFFYYGDPSSYAELVFNTFDEDGNGEISFEEFVLGLSRLWRGTPEEKMAWVFQLYDTHDQGFITWTDLLCVTKAIYEMIGPGAYPPITHEVVRRHASDVFRKLDQNGDGFVSLEEFLNLCAADPTTRQCLDLFRTAGYGFEKS